MSALSNLLEGPRPDITPPQVVAAVTAGIPILASMLSAFGVYNLSPEQQDAMSNAVTWAGVLAASMIGGDAALRTARNRRKAAIETVLASQNRADELEITNDVRTPVPTVVSPPPSSPVAPQTSGPAAGFEPPPE